MNRPEISPRLKPLLTFAYALALLTLAPAVLSGCEFGRNDSKLELIGYDTSSGYYRTRPQSLDLVAQIAGQVISGSGSVQNIPEDLRSAISNPVLLAVNNPVNGAGAIINNADDQAGFPVIVDQAAGKFARSASGYGTYKDCEVEQTNLVTGDYVKTSESVENGFTVRGNVGFDYDLQYIFSGSEPDCQEWLLKMENCYANDAACESSGIVNSDFVHLLFDAYVESGVFSASQIHAVEGVRFRASYR